MTLYNLSGEMVFEERKEGNNDWNTLSWDLENKLGDQVASGLYVYRIQTVNLASQRTFVGKVVVIH